MADFLSNQHVTKSAIESTDCLIYTKCLFHLYQTNWYIKETPHRVFVLSGTRSSDPARPGRERVAISISPKHSAVKVECDSRSITGKMEAKFDCPADARDAAQDLFDFAMSVIEARVEDANSQWAKWSVDSAYFVSNEE